jgi:hypothetical protein
VTRNVLAEATKVVKKSLSIEAKFGKNIFAYIIIINFYALLCVRQKFTTLTHFLLNRKISPKTGRSGVDVIITVFCDFCQFSARNWLFFSKKQCYDPIFAELALF